MFQAGLIKILLCRHLTLSKTVGLVGREKNILHRCPTRFILNVTFSTVFKTYLPTGSIKNLCFGKKF